MVMSAATAVAAAAQGEAINRANEIWGPYASAKGYTVRVGHFGWARNITPTIGGSVHGVSFAIEYLPDAATTLAVAARTTPLEGNVEVTPEGVASKLAKLFGAQDIIVGHDAFDRKYLVKGSPEATAKRLLDAHTCDRLIELEVVRFGYDGGASTKSRAGGLIMVERAGLAEKSSTLDAMIDAVVHVARATTATAK
jgi:hypothetical protein